MALKADEKKQTDEDEKEIAMTCALSMEQTKRD